MARITIDVDLTPEVEITGYQRYQDGHGLEVRWPLPQHDAVVKNVATTTSPTSSSKQSPRRSGTSTCGSSPVSGFTKLPSIAVAVHLPAAHYPPVQTQGRILHLSLRAVRAPLADRQHGGGGCPSLGNLSETVDRIVENQLTEDRQIDPQRVITDIGLDELSLKKRHRLYVTLMTDLSDPTRPQILAVERGRETRRRR